MSKWWNLKRSTQSSQQVSQNTPLNTPQNSPQSKTRATSWWDSNIGRLSSAIIIPVILSILLFQIQYSITSQYQQKEAANKFLSELEILEPGLNEVNSKYVASREAALNGNLNMTINTRTIYPNSGLYYTNSDDLGKFDHSLTKNLTKFYYDITNAEEARKQMVTLVLILSPDSTASDEEKKMAAQTQINVYKEIVFRTDNAAIIMPELKKELQIVCDKKPFFFW